MYIRPPFHFNDRAALIAFMQRYSFATLHTAKDQVPLATHLPVLVEAHGDEVRLVAHLAQANPQWHDLAAHPVLVVFQGPHAYISPTHYEQERSVPTWNYLAVHAYGRAWLLPEPAQALAVLATTIAQYETSYQPQWDRMPPDYQARLLQGIVAFEVVIEELQGQQKLSQNKTPGEQQHIQEALAASSHQHEREVAAYMRTLLSTTTLGATK